MAEKKRVELTEEEFRKFVEEVVPLMEQIREKVKTAGISDTVNVLVAADGFLNLLACGTGWNFARISNENVYMRNDIQEPITTQEVE